MAEPKKTTKKTPAKKNPTPKKENANTKETKKETKKTTTTKVKTTPKKSSKKIVKTNEKTIGENVVEKIDIKPIQETQNEVQNEENFITISKQEETEDNKIIIILLFLMIIVFIAGVIYIFDYTKNNEKIDDTPNNNIIYNKDETSNNNNNNSNNDTNGQLSYSNIIQITLDECIAKLNKNEKMIVLVASKTCGHCTLYEPKLNAVLNELGYKAYKIDIATFTTKEEYDKCKEVFDINYTPTTLIVANKKVMNSITGDLEKEDINNWLSEHYEA